MPILTTGILPSSPILPPPSTTGHQLLAQDPAPILLCFVSTPRGFTAFTQDGGRTGVRARRRILRHGQLRRKPQESQERDFHHRHERVGSVQRSVGSRHRRFTPPARAV